MEGVAVLRSALGNVDPPEVQGMSLSPHALVRTKPVDKRLIRCCQNEGQGTCQLLIESDIAVAEPMAASDDAVA